MFSAAVSASEVVGASPNDSKLLTPSSIRWMEASNRLPTSLTPDDWRSSLGEDGSEVTDYSCESRLWLNQTIPEVVLDQ